jgi:hypothetical protein
MEMFDEQERFRAGNLLRDFGGYIVQKAVELVENLANIDEAMDVFPED